MGQSKRSTGEVEVDLGRYELRRFGQRIKIEKKPMELLIFLLGRREQMVSREDIVKKLWRSDLFIDTEKTSTTLCGSCAPRWVTAQISRDFLRRLSERGTDSSVRFG